MPLSQSGLSSAIKSEIQNLYGTADDDATLQKFADALAKAIVDHITANALVTVTVTGVQNGPGTAPGTGTVS